MKKIYFFASLSFLSLNLLFSDKISIENPQIASTTQQVAIVGGGIVGALESYYAYLDALKNGTKVRVTDRKSVV